MALFVSVGLTLGGAACDSADAAQDATDPLGEAGPGDPANQPDAASQLDASDPPTPPPPPNAYPDDPAIVSILDSMDDNTAVELDPFKLGGDRVDEWTKKYGQAPHRRDFCNKIAYAPNRGTGMYAGMNHGVPHRLNDAWEYHLGSNTWYLLFFPDPETSRQPAGYLAENAMIEDGYLQTRRHGMVQGSHTWDGLTYDPQLGRMFWANVYENSSLSATFENKPPLEAYANETGQTVDEVKSKVQTGANLWMFDPLDGRWYRQTGPAPVPTMVVQGGALEYVSDLKRTYWYANQWNEIGMWSYDSSTNAWARLTPNGGKSFYHDNKEFTFPPAEAQLRYGSGSRTIVAVYGSRTWHYEIDRNEWSLAVEDAANKAGDAVTTFVYDSVNDVFLLLDPRGGGALRVYRVTTKTWETLSPVGANLPTKVAGYFDPAHNVMVVYDNARQRMWLYRYKRAN